MGNPIPRLAFDVDGVFANFTAAFMAKINQQFGTDYRPEQWTSYGDLSVIPAPFTARDWQWAWTNLTSWEHFWIQMPAYPEVDFQKLDLMMGTLLFNGYFITRRQNTLGLVQDANAQTRIWFENQGIKNASAIVSTPKSGQRLPMLELLGADAYLDDWGQQFLEARAAGINAYLLDRPYNREVETPYRVYSVDEFVGRALGRIVDLPTLLTGRPEVLHASARN